MRQELRGAVWSLAAAGIWAVLAMRSPHLTFHFAPVVAAAAWPIASRRMIAAAGVTALTVVTAVALEVADRLQGPDLIGGSAAVGEAVLFAVVAGAGAALWVVAAGRSTPVTAE
jgi:hypothetical protein